MSKPLTATAIMQLVEAGRVELDAPAVRYVPDFRMADPDASARITIRHLLQHTSGLPLTSCDTRGEAATLAEFVAELRTMPLAAPPGARHAYCSGNYNLLGRVVEVVSGRPFGAYMRERVFAPLAMRHSFADEGAARRDGLAEGHRWLFGATAPARERYNPSQLPSGFLIASAEDMAHFLVAQLNGGRYGDASVLAPASIAAMQAPGVPPGPGGATYGLGWKAAPVGGAPVLQHAGDNYHYHGLAFIDPATRRGAILLTNDNGALAVSTAYREIEAGVARLLVGQEPAPAPALSLPRLYLLVDAALGALLALALWPLVRMRRWAGRWRWRHPAGRPHQQRAGLRLAWELGLPPALLGGARLFLGGNLGAQSWAGIGAAFPNFTLWLWALALVVGLTAATRLALIAPRAPCFPVTGVAARWRAVARRANSQAVAGDLAAPTARPGGGTHTARRADDVRGDADRGGQRDGKHDDLVPDTAPALRSARRRPSYATRWCYLHRCWLAPPQ